MFCKSFLKHVQYQKTHPHGPGGQVEAGHGGVHYVEGVVVYQLKTHI